MKMKLLQKISAIVCVLTAIICSNANRQATDHNIANENLRTGNKVEAMKEKKRLQPSMILDNSGNQSSVSSYTATEKRNLKLIKQSFEEWRKGTGGPYGLLAENAEWTIVGNSLASKTYRSRKEFIDEVITPFNGRLTSRLVPTIKAIYADGDMIIVHFSAEGTVRDGKPYVNTYSWFLKMNNGQITCATAFFDAIAFNDLWNRVEPAK